MLFSEEKINKIPFHGTSKNLIDYFYILGYDDNFIENKILNSNNTYEPIILGSINSAYAKNSFDCSLLSKIVYPINPSKTNVKKNPENLIFSFVFDDLNGLDKISFIGYAYKFYEKIPNNNIYIPKCFVILSQFPFFTSFKIICEEIYIHYIINKITLPTEIYIYNILNFIPSPLNGCLNIDICYFSKYDIALKQLSGYPYIDFNLCYLFNFIPINLFIEIFIYSILENDILLFYENVEILNIILYIIFILNYPCSDSIYLWYIFSIPQNEIEKPTYSEFISKRFCCSLIGINSSYNEKIKINSGFKNYLIVDIGNKKLFYKTKIPINELKIRDKNGFNLYKLKLFLEKSIYKNKKINESKFLDKYIKKLQKELNLIYEEYLQLKNIPNSFLFINNKISDINIKFQETFYIFYLNIISIFYQDNNFLSCYDKFYITEENIFKRRSNVSKMTLFNRKVTTKFFLENNNEQISQYLEEEKIFCNLFQNSTKYEIYFNNFILRFKSLDLYKISLIFSEDFIYMKLSDLNFKSGFFNIIDSLFSNYQIKSKKFYDITFHYFDEYYKSLQDNFPKKNSNKIQINNNIINFYINYINNLNEKDLIKLFPSLELILNSKVNNCNMLSIIDCIENKMLSYKLIEPKQIFGNCLMILNNLFKCEDYFDKRNNTNSFTEMIFLTNNLLNYIFENNYSFFRKYFLIILNDFYLMIKKINNDKEKIINSINLLESYYFIFCNFIRTNCIYPNSFIIYLLTILLNEFKKIKEEIPKINLFEEENEEDNEEDEINILYNTNIKNEKDIIPEIKLTILNSDIQNLIEMKNFIKNESRDCYISFKKDKINNNKNETNSNFSIISFSFNDIKRESYIYSLKKLLYSSSLIVYNNYSNKNELINILINLLFHAKIIVQCPYENIINLITNKLLDLIKKDEEFKINNK